MSRANRRDKQSRVERDTDKHDKRGAEGTNIRKSQRASQNKSAQDAQEEDGTREERETNPESVMCSAISMVSYVPNEESKNAQEEVDRHLYKTVACVLRCNALREDKSQ